MQITSIIHAQFSDKDIRPVFRYGERGVFGVIMNRNLYGKRCRADNGYHDYEEYEQRECSAFCATFKIQTIPGKVHRRSRCNDLCTWLSSCVFVLICTFAGQRDGDVFFYLSAEQQ